MNTGIDQILEKLQQTSLYDINLTNDDLIWLCMAATKILRDEPTVLKLQAPITICGDIHGQYNDLLRIFNLCGLPPQTNYLFLGDYVDRGQNNIETISYLFALKIKYPKNIYLLRGNHETEEISKNGGFFDEFKSKGIPNTWYSFTQAFSFLPLAAVIGRRIFCVHGGISPDLESIKQIETIKKPIEIPTSGVVCDLVWSDPADEGNGWQDNDRGCSFTYGPDVVEDFLRRHKFDLLCRAHQVADDGFDFPFKGRQSCVTVFTAPNYCGEANAGAVMRVGEDMTCAFEYLEPEEEEEEDNDE